MSLDTVVVVVGDSWPQHWQWEWSSVRRGIFTKGCKRRITGIQW